MCHTKSSYYPAAHCPIYGFYLLFFFLILPRSRDTGHVANVDFFTSTYIFLSFPNKIRIVIYEKRVNLTNTAIRVQTTTTTTTTATNQYTTEPCSTRYFDPWGFKRNRAVGSEGPNIIMRTYLRGHRLVVN